MSLISTKIRTAAAAAAIAAAISVGALAQKPAPTASPATPETPTPAPLATPKIVKVFGPKINAKVQIPAMAGPGETIEKFIKTDPAVNVSLCVIQGDVKVSGWNRSEVRIFVSNGTKFGYKVQQKSTKSGDPVWITVAAQETPSDRPGQSVGECIRGDVIEIDAPENSTFNIRGQEIATVVDGIRRVDVRNAGGDISIRNIASGVTASTYRGDLVVERSMGAITLQNTSGNIVIYDAGPSEIGDILRAKTTSGAISVQKIEHRQIEVNSISGSVAYNGDVLTGGSYTFGTSNGSIKLTLPASTACSLVASYAYGAFSSDLVVKVATENESPGPIKRIVGTIGTGGDATLKLTSNNGSISIKKQL